METTTLPCPECHRRGTVARIGNRRTSCRTCNLFAQRVMRRVRTALAARYPADYADLRHAVETDEYDRIMAAFEVAR